MDKFDPWVKKFTPGPWWVSFKNPHIVVAPEQPPVLFGSTKTPCIVVQTAFFVDTDNREWAANARLIAAAPDLLDVCERLLYEAEIGDVVINRRLFELTQTAVNKVYGYQRVQLWSHEWQGG